VSELWTPGGGDPREPAANPDDLPEGPGLEEMRPDGPPPTAEEMEAVRELHERLSQTPVADVIVNHAIGIWQLALVHLGVVTPPDDQGRRPKPDLAAAGLAIDALAALVDGLTDRLGDGEPMLRDALLQAQMLYVEIADAQG
jgi:hypothetical protein